MSIWYIMSEILNGLLIRPMDARDIDAVMAIDSVKQPKKKFAADNQFGIVAQKDDAIVGYLSFTFVHRSWEINRILVAEEHRRQGIGSAMATKLSGALDDATPRIFTYVGESHLDAQCFFKNLGYRAVPGIMGTYTRTETVAKLGEPSYLMVYSILNHG